MTAVAEVSAIPRSSKPATKRARESVAPSEFASLAGMLGHELKNPLASAITNIAVAAEFCEADDPRRAFIDRASIDLERVRILLGSCLDLARSETVRPQDVEVREFVDRFVDSDVSVDVDPTCVRLAPIDAHLVQRAIENVIENARREATSIHVRVESTRSHVLFAIEDDGPGIDASRREAIFEPFQSGRNGTGLGLFFVRRVCNAHGGAVRVTSATPCGARFELAFPLEPSSRA